MRDTIKIWKSDLQALLEEVVGPVYVFGASATSNGQIPTTTSYVSVAGFNNEGKVCELRIPQASVPLLFRLCSPPSSRKRTRRISGFSTKSKGDCADLIARPVMD